MNKNFLGLMVLLFCTVLFISYSFTHAFFSDAANSTSNIFSAAAEFPTTPTPTPGQIAQTLVINEVLPHSACKQGQAESQFVELWNGTNSDIDLQNFKLSDGTNTIAISNSNKTVPSHSFAILVKDAGLIGNGKCIPDVHGAITPNLGGQVNLDTGMLQLLDAGNTVIDTVKWGTQSAGLSPIIEQSVERVPHGRDTALGINFNASDFIVRETVTPGYGTDILLNEFIPHATTEQVELFNPSFGSVNLTGWTLVDLANTSKSISSLGTIAIGGFAFFSTPAGWLNDTGPETLFLKDPGGLIIDSHSYTGSITLDKSIGRTTDGTSIWKQTCTTSSIGSTNNGGC